MDKNTFKGIIDIIDKLTIDTINIVDKYKEPYIKLINTIII